MDARSFRNGSSLLTQVRESVAEFRKATRYSSKRLHVIVAVSGGEDSVALLDLLWRIRIEAALDLSVVHVDHRLRAESPGEAEFVERLALRYDLPFRCYVAPPKPSTENLEQWAREVRYQFLRSAALEFRADVVATAHHLNDFAETVLFRMISGRLATSAQLFRGASDCALIRPLLPVTKDEIQAYVAEQKLPFVTDPSNADLARTRNRVRHELLPHLESTYNPAVVRALNEVGERLSEDEIVLWGEAARVLNGWNSVQVQVLAEIPAALRWRVLKLVAVRDVGEVAERLGYRALRELATGFDSDHLGAPLSKSVDLGFGIRFNLGTNGEISFDRVDVCRSPTEISVLPSVKEHGSDVRDDGLLVDTRTAQTYS